jgi:hypothetical protein
MGDDGGAASSFDQRESSRWARSGKRVATIGQKRSWLVRTPLT